jgi:dUTP pyrophosphatase
MASESAYMNFPDDVRGLSRESHKKVRATCQLQISEKCPKEVEQEYRSIMNVIDRNNGAYMCFFCSKKSKFSGRANPNCKYKTLDDNFFSVIDTEAKSYLLGWIASDGSVRENGVISIRIHERDESIIPVLRDIVDTELPIFRVVKDNKPMVGVRFCSKNMVTDICRLLNIEPGNKSGKIHLPKLSCQELMWAFIRGFFDGDGSIRKFTDNRVARECSIASISMELKNEISSFCGIHNYINDNIGFSGVNAIDFLSKIYDEADPKFRLPRKYNLYLEYLNFSPGLPGLYGKIPRCKFVLTNKNAVAPKKNNASDEGYDLWIIGVDKKISNITTRYETGIKIQPEDGWHAEILPRSSLSNSGYMLANSIGLIDESYRATLKIVLTKIDPEAKDIELPFKCVQLVLRRSIHFICDEDDELDDTTRGEGGFGSTDIQEFGSTDIQESKDEEISISAYRQESKEEKSISTGCDLNR